MAAGIPDPALLVGGQWRRGSGDARFAVTDPSTDEIVLTYCGACDADVQEAIEASSRAFGPWSRRTAAERGALLRSCAAKLRERADAIARLLTLEEGKPLGEARREVDVAAAVMEWYAEEGRRAYGRVIPSSLPGAEVRTELVPVGPVAAFTPWNFPVMLSAIKVAAALAAGCTVILRPAEETPLAVGAFVRAMVDAGLPDGALALLLGGGAEISAALLAHPSIAKFSFTGSIAVGRLIAEQAGRHLKPCTLELGGHAPAIVCDDADVDACVSALAMIKFRNAGQVCANASRFFVHESVLARFVDAIKQSARALRVGPGLDPASTMGPLANRRRVQAMHLLVEDARAGGARVEHCGGAQNARGCFYPPTVLVGVAETARLMTHEPFGPLVPVVGFSTLDEAIARANALPVGLSGFGFTRSLASARRLSSELRVGSVGINTTALMLPEAPFGGVAQSGWGRENGAEGLLDFMAPRTVVLAG